MTNATWDFFLGIMVRSWALDGNLPILLYHAFSMVYIYLNIYHIQFCPKCRFLPQTLTLIWMYDSQDPPDSPWNELGSWRKRPRLAVAEKGSPPGDIDLRGSLDLCDWKHDPHQVDFVWDGCKIGPGGEVWNFPLTTVKSHTFGKSSFCLIFFDFLVGWILFFFCPGIGDDECWFLIVYYLSFTSFNTIKSVFGKSDAKKNPSEAQPWIQRRHVCDFSRLYL